MAPTPLAISVARLEHKSKPDHHVTAPHPVSWGSALSPWSTAVNKKSAKRDPKDHKAGPEHDSRPIASFKNPWPSFHKPTPQELWKSLAFGADQDSSIQLAASHSTVAPGRTPSAATRAKQAEQLLRIEAPDFSFDGAKYGSKSTWLGHASMLLQLPALSPGEPPIRVLYDPIFSMRCSPSQSVGPIRSYPPPCKLEDLPPVHLVLISHNHYDHLDHATIVRLWKRHNATIRFIVPLKNKQWFIECGIDADRVEELDWWDSSTLTIADAESAQLRITCTPAQHSSGGRGADANKTLWSSWYLEHRVPYRDPFRVFFAGDTGYQFHENPAWPPQPPSFVQGSGSKPHSAPHQPPPSKNMEESSQYPACPAFKEIATRLGPPHLLYLPLALGATWAYFKSFTSSYLPETLDPFPRHSPGVAGAIHMPPWDAVRVLRVMTEDVTNDEQEEARKPVAIGMHWGTFVTDQTEVLKTLGQLEWACSQQDVNFYRSQQDLQEPLNHRASFFALNHGQSVLL